MKLSERFYSYLENIAGYKITSCDLVFPRNEEIDDKFLKKEVKLRYNVKLITNYEAEGYDEERHQYYLDRFRKHNLWGAYESLITSIENFLIYNKVPYKWVRKELTYDFTILDGYFEWGDIFDLYLANVGDDLTIDEEDNLEYFISCLKGYEEDTIRQYTEDEVIDLLYNYCECRGIYTTWIDYTSKWSTHIKRYNKKRV